MTNNPNNETNKQKRSKNFDIQLLCLEIITNEIRNSIANLKFLIKNLQDEYPGYSENLFSEEDMYNHFCLEENISNRFYLMHRNFEQISAKNLEELQELFIQVLDAKEDRIYRGILYQLHQLDLLKLEMQQMEENFNTKEKEKNML